MSDPRPTADDLGLSGKVAIVTGGGAPDDGIGNGRAAAMLLASVSGPRDRAERSIRTYPIFCFSSAITSRTVMPSARAAKLRAIRCCRTGSASARTSSSDGA